MPYNEGTVDALYEKFEKCAQRQNANKSSAVKLRAAEADLLRITENVRDLLKEAVKGDRELLVAVFGGNCKRFHKFRQVKDTVELSPMHEKDPRWQDLTDMMDTVEEILKQLGTFKPFVIEKKIAPEISSYRGLQDRFTPGDVIHMRPECDGAEADSFSIKPALPSGLTLNEQTGEISGSVNPGDEVPKGTYRVTAKNTYGTAQVDLTFSIAQPAPKSVSYPDAPDACYTNEFVSWTPDVDGGAPKSWCLSPSLPEGLSLDPQTGSISGTPTAVTEPTQYTITAKNASGTTSAVLNFGVKPAPPVSLTYPDLKGEYPTGSVIYLRPDVALKTSGAARPMSAGWNRVRAKVLKPKQLAGAIVMPDVTFSVEPSLPEGLTLIRKTGVISGTASAPFEANTYRVTCRNDGGEISTDLRFGVKPKAPSSLHYSQETLTFFLGQPVSVSPEVDGSVSEWKVEPALPPGMNLDPALGILSGLPSEVVPEGSWTVTASNAEGETSAVLTFSVQRAAPSGLEYPGLLEEYPVQRPLELRPRVEGQVEEFSVTPPLPDGLSLDPLSGVISGTPTSTGEATSYLVSAKNETGSTSTSLTFGVKVIPPEALSYPQVDDEYSVGEGVSLVPEVTGGATSWTVEPALPSGLALDPATGAISGSPSSVQEDASYVVTASNEAGGTSVVLTFSITAPRPEGLAYPDATDECTVGSPVTLEPQLKSGVCTTFSVSPELPAGLVLDATTGVISGSPSAETDKVVYTVSATNPAGSCSTDLSFSVVAANDTDETTGVDQKFAAIIEEITDIADLVEEPGKNHNLGDWMIWMVHRAWLNDPSLTDFNFCNKWMPPPHMEPRIAPKLMKAIGHNTHIISLQLANANVMKPQGHQLAESLKTNTTIRILNIETNSLDSDGLSHIAASLKENENTGLEQLRFNNQRGLGEFFGRPVEEAFAELADQNLRLIKLGFTCNDAHWRMKIDRALLRNNDLARRKRKGSAVTQQEEEIAAQNKPLARVLFTDPPDKPVWEVFDLEDERATVARGFMAENKRLPTKEQLQSYARSRGKAIPYSAVATVVKDVRTHLMNAAVNSNVKVYDIYGADFQCSLRGWTEKNDRWSLDLWQGGKTRYNFSSDKQPILEMTEDYAAWVCPSD